MTTESTPEIKHCPYCGSDEIKFVSNVPRCLNCRAVFTATFSRYARKSSANFDKAIEEFKATLANSSK